MTTSSTVSTSALRVNAGAVQLDGDFTIPTRARGLVIFAHGSGSSRHSPRNRSVARALVDGGFATLLADLLTREEEEIDRHSGALRFNIALLGERVLALVDAMLRDERTAQLPIGLFGASTGAAAALLAAARRPKQISALVSRGGRPDLAGVALSAVEASTLLIVGQQDPVVIELNEIARRQLRCRSELRIVPRATHLFEEPGALEEVARLALEWFGLYLSAAHAKEEGCAKDGIVESK
ncbi:MAG: dienelactone hydrolase family protein [Planctomycetota bacterium]